MTTLTLPAWPDGDRYSHDTAYLLGRIKMLLGGRAAEELVYGTVTTGAASDLEQATNIARNMVGRWGMSPSRRPGHHNAYAAARIERVPDLRSQ
jgi:ATP-dependent Zn protease